MNVHDSTFSKSNDCPWTTNETCGSRTLYFSWTMCSWTVHEGPRFIKVHQSSYRNLELMNDLVHQCSAMVSWTMTRNFDGHSWMFRSVQECSSSHELHDRGAGPGWSGVVWVSCPAFPGSNEMPLPGNILNPGLSGTLLVSTYVHRGDAAIVRGSDVVGPAYSGVCWVYMCSPTELWQYPGIVQARPGRVPV